MDKKQPKKAETARKKTAKQRIRRRPAIHKREYGQAAVIPLPGFPMEHFSASSMIKFATNPFMFRVNILNRQQLETTYGVRALVGQAFHVALEAYYSLNAVPEAVAVALEEAETFIRSTDPGAVAFSPGLDDHDKAVALMAYVFGEYIAFRSKFEGKEVLACEQDIKTDPALVLPFRSSVISLPVPLRGRIDKVCRDKKGRLVLVDYKTCGKFSDADRIDGAKMLQASIYYFLALHQYGEAPHSFIFQEVKTSKNKDKSSQVREYEIVYAKNPLFFDFFLRLYEDMTKALNGRMVYVPNINAIYDNEISLIAYIHRLDEDNI